MIGTNEYHGDEDDIEAERRNLDENNPNDEPCFDDEPPKHQFIIQMYTVCDGWEDFFHESFYTFADAVNELDSFLTETNEDYELGYLSEPYNRYDYRIRLI